MRDDTSSIGSFTNLAGAAAGPSSASVAGSTSAGAGGQAGAAQAAQATGGSVAAVALGDFTCPLCMELLYRPCTIDCGHNICQPWYVLVSCCAPRSLLAASCRAKCDTTVSLSHKTSKFPGGAPFAVVCGGQP